jgi:hypothetical protein
MTGQDCPIPMRKARDADKVLERRELGLRLEYVGAYFDFATFAIGIFAPR